MNPPHSPLPNRQPKTTKPKPKKPPHAQGISNYARAPADVKASDMESAVAKYDAELAAMGISLTGLTSGPNAVSFIYNEVAVGGGASECGDVTATEPWQVRFLCVCVCGCGCVAGARTRLFARQGAGRRQSVVFLSSRMNTPCSTVQPSTTGGPLPLAGPLPLLAHQRPLEGPPGRGRRRPRAQLHARVVSPLLRHASANCRFVYTCLSLS